MKRYSLLSLARNALSGHKGWEPAWRSPEPAKCYDVVIVGGGGHGLATAFYLARDHGIRNVAVLEKGQLGGGNTGRNTQTSRSNYFWPASAAFYDHSLRLFETLGPELNFNIMLSQRGVVNLAHSPHELEQQRRWVNAIQLNGIDSESLDPEQLSRLIPLLNLRGRYPILGGFIQARGGVSRHDAVAWGYARAADALGVDLIQQCEVTGFAQDGERVIGVKTTRGAVGCDRVLIATSGHTSELGTMLGLPLPITSLALQAMVSEPLKPCLDTVVVSPTVHVYVSQSDRGELVIGGGTDLYASYAQRGSIATMRDTVCALLELFPAFSRLRLMRQWAGLVDITPDMSPIMGLTSIKGLYISAGWGTGGYKAIPAGGKTMAWTIANDSAHPLIREFGLERFATGALIDEGAAAGVAH